MNGFELVMCQGSMNEWRKHTIVEKFFPSGQVLAQGIRGRWNIEGLIEGGARRTNPILGSAEVTGRRMVTSDSSHQLLVQFSNETQRNRQGVEALDSIF